MATQRVMVYIICWLSVLDNAGAGPILRSEWIDVTANGSSDVVAYKEAVALEEPGNHKAVVTQYHVYYADGGHARFKERYYLIEEAALWPSVPTADPSVLLPTPEYLP
ncbi:hypothetical protein [Pseudomonas phage COT4]|uniref:Uncharacterized protein n=1 Tax=Pseudomonas phage M5.1 TaxID=2873460 RepID=A0AAE9BNK4_9CAUD|nr:hypothetical protein QGX13_gp018 [Pseudomonas phage M5.1]UAV89619.1 hypothetical protein M51_18 [Pseudomonas phage M5.1]UAV89888.1 hypothetical protein REC_18 [Pseudomonas phage REC]UGL61218.1 hypothetical protein [Pseudomonas phage COT4]UGL62614.1 hypothetical protein [Pseudomonas phage REC1]